MTPHPAADRDPYVGPRPFTPEEHDRFFGRRWETGQVTDLLLAERIVLLFSPSGAGKTSLIEAGVRKALKDEGLAVLPLARVNAPPAAALAARANRYLASTIATWDKPLPEELRQPEEKLAGLDVGAYLKERRRRVQERRREVLVFDQLEEILTLDPYDVEADRARLEWFAAIGAALQADRGLWALFSMREDYLGQLGQYFEAIPSGLAIRFRLDALQKPAAIEAIRQPVAKFAAPDGRPVVFTEPAARWIAEEIAKVQVQQGVDRVEIAGRYVEAVQLQVVCDRLWKGMRWTELPTVDGAAAIEETYVKTHAQIADALGDYYDERVAAIAAGDPAAEGKIRRWFDRHLITDRLTRGQVRRGAEDEALRLSDETLVALARDHLIRRDVRHDSDWYELSHDRLVEPVRLRNRAWHAKRLAEDPYPFARLAREWDERDRQDDRFLLGGPRLAEAEAWFAAHEGELDTEIGERVRDFLAAGRGAAESRRWQRTKTILYAGGGALAVVLAVLALMIWLWRRESDARNDADALRAETERQNAILRVPAVAGRAEYWLGRGEADRGRLLARQAYNFYAETAGAAHEPVDRALRTALPDASSGLVLFVVAEGAEPIVLSQRFSAIGLGADGTLATASAGASGGAANSEWTLTLWAPTAQEGVVISMIPAAERRPGEQGAGPVAALAVSPDGRFVAVGSSAGGIQLWDTAHPDGPALLLNESAAWPVIAVAVSPDGRFVAAGGCEVAIEGTCVRPAEVRLWARDEAGGAPTSIVLPAGVSVSAIAISWDGELVATGSSDRTVRLWARSDPRTAQGLLSDPQAADVSAIAFDPEGRTLATGSSDGSVRLWALGSPGNSPVMLSGEPGRVTALAFSADGSSLAVATNQPSAASRRFVVAVRIWATTKALADLVCERVTRNLTPGEWESDVGDGTDYEATCKRLAAGGTPVAATPVPTPAQPIVRGRSSGGLPRSRTTSRLRRVVARDRSVWPRRAVRGSA